MAAFDVVDVVVAATVAAAAGSEAKALESGSSGTAAASEAAAVVFSGAETAATAGATALAAAGAAKPPLPRPPSLPSGDGDVRVVAPLLLFPAVPGLSRPMNDDVAKGDVEAVVVISWERTRAAVWRARSRREVEGLW